MEQIDILKGVILPYINFILFLLMAFWFFKKPIKEALKKSRESYYHNVKEAEEALRQAEASHQQIEQKLQALSASTDALHAKQGTTTEVDYLTVDSIKEKARKEAEEESKNTIKKAEELAKKLREEAERIAQAEIEKARETLKKEILETVKQKVVERIGTELNDEAKTRLARKKVDLLDRTNLEV